MIRKPNSRIWIGSLLALLAIAVGDMINRHRALFFQLSPTEASRAIYHFNPFHESIEIARYIAEHTDANDRIAVIGSEPQIYFYSKRRSATGYIYAYPMMEPHRYAAQMQQEMIEEIEAANPKFLIDVHVPPPLPPGLLEWLGRYTDRSFQTVGLITLKESESSVSRWDLRAIDIPPGSDDIAPVSDVYVKTLMRSNHDWR